MFAEDGDLVGPNGLVQYWIEEEDNTEMCFGVEPFTGRVFVRRAALGELLKSVSDRSGGKDYYDHCKKSKIYSIIHIIFKIQCF